MSRAGPFPKKYVLHERFLFSMKEYQLYLGLLSTIFFNIEDSLRKPMPAKQVDRVTEQINTCLKDNKISFFWFLFSLTNII